MICFDWIFAFVFLFGGISFLICTIIVYRDKWIFAIMAAFFFFMSGIYFYGIYDDSKIINCPDCHYEMQNIEYKTYSYCPNCQYEFISHCNNCGKELEKTMKNCPYCSKMQNE